MDRKLKIKYRKKEKKYVVDYNKVKDKRSCRYELLKQLNGEHDFVVCIDSSHGKKDPEQIVGESLLFLENSDNHDKIINALTCENIEYRSRTRKRREQGRIMGLAVGKEVTREDIIFVAYIEKGKLTKEIFEALLNTHDYSLGIDPAKSVHEIMEDVHEEDRYKVEEMDYYSHTLYDSHFLAYFYTDYKFE